MRRPGSRHPFALWLGAATLSTLGDSVTYFVLGWVLAGYGAGTASLVLTLEGIPLCVLILLGGTLADRWGIRRMMIGCDAAMALVMAVFAVGTLAGVPLWSLVVVALISATSEALRRPANGVFPRLFATGDELTRTMAVTTSFQQLARIAGPAVGGVLLGLGGLTMTSALDAATFALVLGVLLIVRPPYEQPPAKGPKQSALRQLTEGVAVARRTPGAPATLLSVVGLAITVLPLVALCVPLAGHAREWSAQETGVVTAAWIVGGLLVTSYVAKWGAPSRAFSLAGPGLAATGAMLLAATSGVVSAFCALGLVGVGVSLVTTRLIPWFVDATPPAMLARFHALLGVAQTGPVLVATPVLGAAASYAGVGAALCVLAGVLAVTTLAVVAAERVIADQGAVVEAANARTR